MSFKLLPLKKIPTNVVALIFVTVAIIISVVLYYTMANTTKRYKKRKMQPSTVKNNTLITSTGLLDVGDTYYYPLNMTLLSLYDNDYDQNVDGSFNKEQDNWNWCAGNYTRDINSFEYTQVPNSQLETKQRKIRKEGDYIRCYNDSGFSELRHIYGKDYDDKRILGPVAWIENQPSNFNQPPPKMRLTGFGYAECDGIYIYDLNRRLYRHENGKRIVLVNKNNILTCYPNDRIGSYGSRKIQFWDQNIHGYGNRYIIGETVNWTNADASDTTTYVTLATNIFKEWIVDDQSYKKFYMYQPDIPLTKALIPDYIIRKARVYGECNYTGNNATIICGVIGSIEENFSFYKCFPLLGPNFVIKSIRIPADMMIVLYRKSLPWTDQMAKVFFSDTNCIDFNVPASDLQMFVLEVNSNGQWSQNLAYDYTLNRLQYGGRDPTIRSYPIDSTWPLFAETYSSSGAWNGTVRLDSFVPFSSFSAPQQIFRTYPYIMIVLDQDATTKTYKTNCLLTTSYNRSDNRINGTVGFIVCHAIRSLNYVYYYNSWLHNSRYRMYPF